MLLNRRLGWTRAAAFFSQHVHVETQLMPELCIGITELMLEHGLVELNTSKGSRDSIRNKLIKPIKL